MNLTEDQLKTWANPPSATKYIVTRNRIEKALKDAFNSKIKVYLQGSYKNSTNVRSESDVDIVVEYILAHYPGFFQMSQEEKERYYREIHSTHSYTQPEFKKDVIAVLEDEFNTGEVIPGNKAIRVLKNENRVNADVIACFTHKRYVDYANYDENAVGIQFFTDDGTEVINFPDQHHKNGEEKNNFLKTHSKYKDTVRIFKNIRYRLIEERWINKEDISSIYATD